MKTWQERKSDGRLSGTFCTGWIENLTIDADGQERVAKVECNRIDGEYKPQQSQDTGECEGSVFFEEFNEFRKKGFAT